MFFTHYPPPPPFFCTLTNLLLLWFFLFNSPIGFWFCEISVSLSCLFPMFAVFSGTILHIWLTFFSNGLPFSLELPWLPHFTFLLCLLCFSLLFPFWVSLFSCLVLHLGIWSIWGFPLFLASPRRKGGGWLMGGWVDLFHKREIKNSFGLFLYFLIYIFFGLGLVICKLIDAQVFCRSPFSICVISLFLELGVFVVYYVKT